MSLTTSHDATSTLSDTIVPTTTSSRQLPNWLSRFARRGVLQHLQTLTIGRLQVQETHDSSLLTHQFGIKSEADTDLRAQINVTDGNFFPQVAFGGSIGFAESYLQGHWSTDDLTQVLRLFARNSDVADRADTGLVAFFKWLARRWHERHQNSMDGSAKNIHAHYDLGNNFYRLFLDETMTYSCGIFETPQSTLHEASVAKVDRICRKLDLKPTDHLLEIGTGWGYLAVHAVKNYGCKVTTTTISREQFEFAKQRVRDAGFDDRITLLLQDYRTLTGQYDKLVTVEMIEAVGYEYFDTFFRKCGELLKPTGQMVMQGITMNEQRYARYLKSVDFIQRFIFPGGCLITPGTVCESVTRTTDMRLLHLEDLAPHYAETLRCWRQRFFERIDEVRQQGFPESFIRLWEYYLCYCEAAFEERLVGTVQMQFAKPRCHSDALRPFL